MIGACAKNFGPGAATCGEFGKCAYLISRMAMGSTLSQVSVSLGLSREQVTRKYRRKAMKMLAIEFMAEVGRRVQS